VINNRVLVALLLSLTGLVLFVTADHAAFERLKFKSIAQPISSGHVELGCIELVEDHGAELEMFLVTRSGVRRTPQVRGEWKCSANEQWCPVIYLRAEDGAYCPLGRRELELNTEGSPVTVISSRKGAFGPVEAFAVVYLERVMLFSLLLCCALFISRRWIRVPE
jgi:hypothetical protein